MNEYAVINVAADDGVHAWCESAEDAVNLAAECNLTEDGTFRAVEANRYGYWVSLTGEALYV